jgi:hypothetical protein
MSSATPRGRLGYADCDDLPLAIASAMAQAFDTLRL